MARHEINIKNKEDGVVALIIKRDSITNKILKIMAIGLLIQAIVFPSMMLLNGTIKNMKINGLNKLYEKTDSKENQIQWEMLHHWGNIYGSTEKINQKILEMLNEKNYKIDNIKKTELCDEIINNISSDLTDILKDNYVTGAFVILDSPESIENTGDKQGLYIKNDNPLDLINTEYSIKVKIGSTSVVDKLGLPRDEFYRSTFNFNGNFKDENFFYKPIRVAKKEITSYIQLGYWNPVFSLNNDNIDIITFSLPLIDGDKNVYGIVGIDISIDYLNDYIIKNKSNDIDYFAIGILDNYNRNFDNIKYIGKEGKNIVLDNKKINIR